MSVGTLSLSELQQSRPFFYFLRSTGKMNIFFCQLCYEEIIKVSLFSSSYLLKAKLNIFESFRDLQKKGILQIENPSKIT